MDNMDNKDSVENEKNTAGYFEETLIIPGGIHAKKHLHWSDINSLARMLANASLMADDKAGTLVYTGPSLFAKTFLFLTYCTDCDTKQFEYPESEDGELGGEINADALMDWAMETGLDRECFAEWCESWEVACELGDTYASVLCGQYCQEHDIGHRLMTAFGDVLDGTSEEVVKSANGLGEMLIDLIGKSREAAKPQGGVVNFAKKK